MAGKMSIREPYANVDYRHAISINNNVYILNFSLWFFSVIYVYVALILYKVVDPQNAVK
jgi:hypothetical protein